MKNAAFLLLVIIAFMSAGCLAQPDNNNGSCTFDLDAVFNGTNISVRDSEWDCTAAAGFFTWALFSDGTGFNTDLGGFDWFESGCAEIEFSTASDTGLVSDMQLSDNNTQLTFIQLFGGGLASAQCVLDTTPDAF